MKYYAHLSHDDNASRWSDMPDAMPVIEAESPGEARQILIDRFRMVGFKVEPLDNLYEWGAQITSPNGWAIVYRISDNELSDIENE